MIVQEQRRLKYAATINDEVLGEDTPPDLNISYVDISNVDSLGTIHDVVDYTFEKAPSRARRVVRHGDVIISTVRTYLQAIAPIENPPPNLIVSTGFAVLRARLNDLLPDFCKYALREPRFLWEVITRSVGVSYPAINASDLGDIRIDLPPLETQHRIADFLDRETARIDALIAAKERLLTLLAEKRRALITHAVTRGLNPDAPLRDSGLPWLGMIPAHWELLQQKRAWASAEYGLSESIRDEGSIAVLRMSCIMPDGGVDLEQAGQIEEAPAQLLIRKGDLLFNRTNSLDQIAKVGLVRYDPERETSYASYLVRIRTNHRALPEYMAHLLNSQGFLAFARGHAIPAIGQANLNPSRYGDLHIPLPPVGEQEKIAGFIDNHQERYSEFAANLQHSVRILRERRSALIAAAITGQLAVES